MCAMEMPSFNIRSKIQSAKDISYNMGAAGLDYSRWFSFSWVNADILLVRSYILNKRC